MTTKLVRDLMHIGVVTCQADTSLVEAVRTLLREDLESLIILDDNSHAVGMLSRREAVAVYGRSGADMHDVLPRFSAGCKSGGTLGSSPFAIRG